MTVLEALGIVVDLASANILDDDSPDMSDEVSRQELAVKLAEKLVSVLEIPGRTTIVLEDGSLVEIS